jgi:hypothetical protein
MSLMSRIAQFARSPQGRRAAAAAMAYAQSPKGRAKIEQARRRLAARSTARKARGRGGEGNPPAARRPAWFDPGHANRRGADRRAARA